MNSAKSAVSVDTTAITQLNNWVLESMDEGKVTGLLFVDISKAFNSLNHKVLLRKLNHLGVSERSLRWFRSYLADRIIRATLHHTWRATRQHFGPLAI